MDAGDLAALKAEIELARKRLKLPDKFRVLSCYEAGRDGFWLHRYLTMEGITNLIVDSASIEVNRRKRRAKADKLDASAGANADSLRLRRTQDMERVARSMG